MNINARTAAWIIGLGYSLGLMYRFVFNVEAVGFGLFLYMLSMFGAFQGLKYAVHRKLTFRRIELLYLPLFAVSLVPSFTQSQILTDWSLLLTFGGALLLANILFTHESPDQFNLLRMVAVPGKLALLALTHFVKPFAVLAQRLKQHRSGDQTTEVLSKVVLGVLISIPLMVLFMILFLSADQAFSDLINFGWFWKYLGDAVGSMIVIALAGLLWVGIMTSWLLTPASEQAGVTKRHFDPIVSTVVSIMLNSLFGFFVIVQFVYLFAGDSNIQRLGITYAQYARQGFNELLWAAGLSGVIVFSISKFGMFRHKAYNVVLQTTLIVQLLLTGVILYSAYFRTLIYQQAYGLTEIRLYTFVFLLYVAALLVYLCVAVVSKQVLKHFSIAAFSLACIMLSGFALLDPQGIIASHNLARRSTVVETDPYYIIRDLSSDGYIYVAEQLTYKWDRRLMCWLTDRWIEENHQRDSLPEFNFRRAINAARLNQILNEEGYLRDGEVGQVCLSLN